MFDSKKIIAEVCANNVCQWPQASTPEVLSASETNTPLKADGHLTHAEDPDPPRSCAFHGSDCPLNTVRGLARPVAVLLAVLPDALAVRIRLAVAPAAVYFRSSSWTPRLRLAFRRTQWIPPPARFEDRTVAKENMMQTVRDSSQQDRRVYVGNLSYDVKWHHLKDFMRQGEQGRAFGMGCGIVEYATRDQAQNAVNTLSNQSLMGRLVYVLPRTVNPSPASLVVPPRGDFGPGARGGFGGGFGGHPGGAGGGGRQIYVSNLPFNVGWQDLKDLFRSAGKYRSKTTLDLDSYFSPSRVPSYVPMCTPTLPDVPRAPASLLSSPPDDARNAIAQFNGYDWQGRPLEVREDRFAGGGPGFGGRGGFGGGFGGRGGFGGPMGRGGFAGRGGFGGGFPGRGGFGGPPGGHGGFPGAGGFEHGGAPPVPSGPPNPFTDYATSNGDKSAVIYVRNLPWSTCNEDLIDLFSTIGKVDRAEIQYEPNGRSRGTGVVQFDTPDTAETAIAKFSGYQYGGRPLGITFVKYMNAGPGPDEMMEGQESTVGLTQDQIM
ncbi:hypothetical protein HAV15_002377 [Penicillium sp. str. |nr:hypothetical protein HAV15_002377 [Penicillium sp. str. \